MKINSVDCQLNHHWVRAPLGRASQTLPIHDFYHPTPTQKVAFSYADPETSQFHHESFPLTKAYCFSTESNTSDSQ